MRHEAHGYFRNKHKGEEPLSIECKRAGIRFRSAVPLFEAGALQGTKHEHGGWYVTPAQVIALIGYAQANPGLWLDPPPED